MRTKLNLNEPSSKILTMIGLFLVAIPVVFTVGGFLLSAANVPVNLLNDLRNGSVAAGLILAAGFVILIVVEQIQDHLIDAAYQRNRNRKLPLPAGGFECQYCGSQKVRALDKCCPVCGHLLQ